MTAEQSVDLLRSVGIVDELASRRMDEVLIDTASMFVVLFALSYTIHVQLWLLMIISTSALRPPES